MLYPLPVRNQFLCLVGGFLWLAAVVAYQRRTRGACATCGRHPTRTAGWTTPTAAARWGRRAVYLASLAPCLYAAERFAWAAGIPLGGSQELVDELDRSGLWVAAVALAGMAVVGVTGMLGLVQRWGEVWPRWVLGLAGRPVPAALPITIGLLVSSSLVSLAVPGVIELIRDGGTDLPATANGWLGFIVPWLFPLWGVGLGAATLAYYYRRRGRCSACEQHMLSSSQPVSAVSKAGCGRLVG